MSETVNTPDEDAPPNPWEPVSDLEAEDLEPTEIVTEESEPDPFDPLPDDGDAEVPIPDVPSEESEDPWSDAAMTEPEGLLPTPPMPQWPDPPAVVGILDESRRGPVVALPWRTSAEMRAPTAARLLCEADARTMGSLLRVATWTWVDGSDDHVSFRLADDGEDIAVRVLVPGVPVFEAELRVAGRELAARLELVVDRDARGLVLGRDLLVGRFVIDPAQQDWEL